MPASQGSNLRLTDRDLQLIEDLYWQRLMTSGQIRRLGYFGSQSRCNRRLALLRKAGFIESVVKVAHGSDEQAYVVSKGGKHLLLRSGRIDASNAVGVGLPSLAMARHLYLVAEIQTRLFESGRLSKWIPESRCRHSYYVGDELLVFKPDGVAILSNAKANQICFVEADNGTNSKLQLAKKIASFDAYLTDVFQETYDASTFTILFVTTTHARRRLLAKLDKSSISPVISVTLDQLGELG
jgi:hypothetical protein